MHILAIGTARPDHSMSQVGAAAMAAERCGATKREARVLDRLYRRTMIESRGSTLIRPNGDPARSQETLGWFYPPAGSNASSSDPARELSPTTGERMRQFERLAPDIAADACRCALRDAGFSSEEITHLIVVTCTGFSAPGVDVALIRQLDLPRTVQRTHIGFMGCHASLNGLQVAHALTQADAAARALVCCVELGSLHFQYGRDTQHVVANALFADGAAAIVVGRREPSPSGAASGARDRPEAWRIIGTASYLIDGTEGDMSWHIEDHGFVMGLSPRVPQLIAQHLRPWLDDWLQQHGIAIEDVGSWAIHAGGPRIVSTVAERLGLPRDVLAPSRAVLRECGNMSSATLPFILERIWRERRPLPCVALSFGPGLTVEAALFA